MQSTLAPPARTVEQRHAALQEANRIRLARAGVKKQLRTRAIDLEDALTHPACESARVADLLLSCPRVGPTKLGKILTIARISAAKRVGGLTPRQRLELRHLIELGELPPDPAVPQVGTEGLFA